MKLHNDRHYLTADDLPLGVVAAVELDRIHKDLGGTRGYGDPVGGQWLRLSNASAERWAATMEVSTPPAGGEAEHKAASLPAFMFPLRSIYVASRGGAEIWTRWDDRPGSKNNFVLCECQNPEEAAFIVRACNAYESDTLLIRHISHQRDSLRTANAALVAALTLAESYITGSPFRGHAATHVLDQARAALHAAKQ